MKARQEIHLWQVPAGLVLQGGCGPAPLLQTPLPLPFAPLALRTAPGGLTPLSFWQGAREAAVVVEPFLDVRKQLRLFAMFPPGTAPQVNGEARPEMVVLTPGDLVQWDNQPVVQVLAYNRPLLGPPREALVGKPCPVCRVPFNAKSVCYTCACGVVLHCEEDEKEGLQCAQMRGECPACSRRVVLAEGYATPPSYDD